MLNEPLTYNINDDEISDGDVEHISANQPKGQTTKVTQHFDEDHNDEYPNAPQTSEFAENKQHDDVTINGQTEQSPKPSVDSSKIDIGTIELMLGKRESEQAVKLQNLELMIVKLENKILSQSMEKQDDSTSHTALENHILRLENELLKLNQSYQQLKADHELLNARHGQFLENTEFHHRQQKYLALADNSSREIMTQQQVKITELSRMIQNQSLVVQSLHSRSAHLEDQNQKLFQVVMNQTALISHIMAKMQELSEDSLRSKIQAEELKASLERLKQSGVSHLQTLTDTNVNQTPKQKAEESYDFAIDSSVKYKPANSVVRTDLVSLILSSLTKLPFASWPIPQQDNRWSCQGLNSTALCLSRTLVISNCTPFNDIQWRSCNSSNGTPFMEVSESQNESKGVTGSHSSSPEVLLNDIQVMNQYEHSQPDNGGTSSLVEDTVDNKQQENGPDREGETIRPLMPTSTDESANTQPDSDDSVPKQREENAPKTDKFNQHAEVDKIAILTPHPDNVKSVVHSDEKNTPSTPVSVQTVKSNNDEDHLDNGKQSSGVQSNRPPFAAPGTISSGDKQAQGMKSKADSKESSSKTIHHDHKTAAQVSLKEDHDDMATPGTATLEASSPTEGSENAKSSCGSLGESAACNAKFNHTINPPAGNATQISTNQTHGVNQSNAENIKLSTNHTHNLNQPKVENTSESLAGQPKNITMQTKDKLQAEVVQEDKQEEKKVKPESKASHEALKRKILYEPLYDNRPKDCYDLYKLGHKRSGRNQILVSGLDVYVSVYCDMENGGWTHLLRREDGLLDFYRNFDQYKEGFGAPGGEHYIGNEVIHHMTNQGHYSLRVELQDWKGNRKHAHYDHFWIDGEDDVFQLHISGYSGNAGDGLGKHNGMKFSTYDVDHDLLQKEMGGSCAKRFQGAGWYYKCYTSNLMGRYYKGGNVPEKRFDGVAWKPWLGPGYSLKNAVLSIRPYGVEK